MAIVKRYAEKLHNPDINGVKRCQYCGGPDNTMSHSSDCGYAHGWKSLRDQLINGLRFR